MARPKQFDEAATLQKALGVFWRKGYAATSMQDLLGAMGINAPSLYATYGDKHRLFVQALKSYQQSQHAWMTDLLATDRPVRDILRQLFETMVEEGLTDPERKGCLMVNTTTELANQDAEVACVVADNERALRALLADLVRRGQATHEISPERDPEVLAVYLFTVLQGLRITVTTHQNRAALQATLALILAAL